MKLRNITFVQVERDARILVHYHSYHEHCETWKKPQDSVDLINPVPTSCATISIKLLQPGYFRFPQWSIVASLYAGCLQYCLCLQRLPLFSQAVHSPPRELNSFKWRAASSFSHWAPPPPPPPFSTSLTKHKGDLRDLCRSEIRQRRAARNKKTVKDFHWCFNLPMFS